MVNEIPHPKHYKGLKFPRSISECSKPTGLDFARFTIERLEKAKGGFPIDLLPLKQRISGPLLGAYASHRRNLEYDSTKSLSEIIEMKINGISSKKVILAISAPMSYMAFECKKFSYDILDHLRKATYAINFVVGSIEADALFVFHEDDPACFLSFGSVIEFERDFMSLTRTVSIFSDRLEEWSLTNLEKERKWLHRIKMHFNALV